jgi:osmoprotectant transport system ATP-binding protein
VFVTHNIEEAAKLGDRIAVLSTGGVLEQYDTPAEILGRPSTPFVADFVGTDRGVRRLAVVGVEAADLARPPVVARSATMESARAAGVDEQAKTALVVDGDGALLGWIPLGGSESGVAGDHVEPFAAQVPLGTTLRAALGEMLLHDMRWLPVVDQDERYLGVLDPNRLHAAMRRSVGGTAVES